MCKVVLLQEGRPVVVYDSVGIRGRGNTTWGLEKKPYRLKFNQKTRLLGSARANAKDWVLLANAGDKLLLRNALSAYLGELMKMPFSPAYQFADVYMNGRYDGTYQITDQIEIHKKRVEITKQDTVVTSAGTDVSGGYLLEPEGLTDNDAYYFESKNGCHIRVHSPKPEIISSRQKSYIKAYINKFESALFSDNFAHEQRGYRQFTDTLSLISWYLIQEISAYPDGFWCSFIYKERGDEHLYFGPIWDFDICYNNCSRQGDVTKKLAINFGYGSDYTIKGWYMRMWNDPWFKQAVSRRFNQLRQQGLDSLMCHFVDSMAAEIAPSRIENYRRWSLSTKTYDEVFIFNTYEQYVQQIKTFIREHNDYLSTEFGRLAQLVPTAAFTPLTDYSYKIYSKAFPNMVLAPKPIENATATSIGIYRNQDEDDEWQKWNLTADGDGYVTLVNAQSGLSLCDVGYGSEEQLCVRPIQPATKEHLWKFVPQAIGGYYNLKNVATGHVIYNFDGMADEGNPVYGVVSDSKDASSSNRMWKPLPCGKSVLSAVQSMQSQIDYALSFSRSGNSLRFVCADSNRNDLLFVATIYDLAGNRVATFRADEVYSTQSLPRGTYIVSWVFGGQSQSAKFIQL